MSTVEIKVPDIGGHENVDIIAVEIKAGDTIALDDTLITLETDKATMDVPADAAGVVKEVKVQVGGKVSEGDVIAIVEVAGAAAATAPAAETAPAAAAPAPVQAAPAAAGGVEKVVVPDIGGHENVDVIAVEVKVGDTVAVDDTLITLETDKATMDVPSTAAGTVTAVHIKVGDKVSEGALIIEVAGSGAAAASAPAPQAAAPAPAPASVQAAPAAPAPTAQTPVASGVAAAYGTINEEGTRRPIHTQIGARTGRGFELGERFRPKRPHHCRRREIFCKRRDAKRRRNRFFCFRRRIVGRWLGLATMAESGFQQIRRNRSQRTVAHQKNLRPKPVAQLGGDSARYRA